MAVVDDKYNKLVNKIKDEGSWDTDLGTGQEVRTVYADGTPAYTKSVFGEHLELSAKDTPFITTKRVGYKTALKEVLFFWQKQSIYGDDYHDANVHIWDEWLSKTVVSDRLNIGKAYAYQMESRPKHTADNLVPLVKLMQTNVENTTIERLGAVDYVQTLEGVKLEAKTVTDALNYLNHYKYFMNDDDKLIFDSLGSKATLETYNQLINDAFKGIYLPYMPKLNIPMTKPHVNNLNVVGSVKWHINRDGSMVGYHQYNKKDFKEDNFPKVTFLIVQNLNSGEVFELTEEQWSTLAINGYKSNFPLTTSSNDILNSDSTYLGNISNTNPLWKRINNKNTWEELYNIWMGMFTSGKKVTARWHVFEYFVRDVWYLPQFFLAKEDKFKGWVLSTTYHKTDIYHPKTVVFLSKADEYTYTSNDTLGTKERYKLSKNQVIELITAIKQHSPSRRLMTAFWNYNDVEDKNLQECVWSTQWNIRDGKLDLMVIQRSGDIALGVPYNLAQYGILQRMLAHIGGLELGKMVFNYGNLHYYDRHEELLLNQVNSKTYDNAVINLLPKDDFFDYSVDDLMVKYTNGGTYKYEVAI